LFSDEEVLRGSIWGMILFWWSAPDFTEEISLPDFWTGFPAGLTGAFFPAGLTFLLPDLFAGSTGFAFVFFLLAFPP
jgi:hypothetical protein